MAVGIISDESIRAHKLSANVQKASEHTHARFVIAAVITR
jgi:hypothetical protein